MTRDEAIRKVMSVKGWGDLPNRGPRYEEMATSVDCLVALGVIKFDAPVNVSEQAVSFLIGKCSMPSTHGGDCKQMTEGEARQVVTLIEMAGLKIVEK